MTKRGERRAPTRVDRRVVDGGGPDSTFAPAEIYVIEDDVELATFISFALESAGTKVTVFHNGVDALKTLAALPARDRRRLVLLSVDIGGIDGHTVHERLVELRPAAFLFAFMSVRGGEADQIRALRAGAIDYLVKPVSMQILIEKVAVWRNLIENEQ